MARFKSSANQKEIEFFEVAAEIPSIMNNSLNFIFYMLSGKLFRDAFRKAITERYERIKHHGLIDAKQVTPKWHPGRKQGHLRTMVNISEGVSTGCHANQPKMSVVYQ